MPRQQQKAVFAHLQEDTGYLNRLQSAEGYRRRRSYLLHKKDLEETTEDKIFRIWESNKLTHRQKLDRVAKVKKGAQKKLDAFKKEESQSITADIREIRARKFEKQAKLVEEGMHKVNYISVGGVTYSLKHSTLKDLQELKRSTTPVSTTREQINAEIKLRKSGVKAETIKEFAARRKKGNPDKVKLMRGRQKVRAVDPKTGKEIWSLQPMTGAEKKEFIARKKKSNPGEQKFKLINRNGIVFAQDKKTGKLHPVGGSRFVHTGLKLLKKKSLKDSDKDGVKDVDDCQPFNKNKQDDKQVGAKQLAKNIAKANVFIVRKRISPGDKNLSKQSKAMFKTSYGSPKFAGRLKAAKKKTFK